MPRIYVASLSDYNNGRLHGAWIDLDGKSADDVQGEIAAMLATGAPGAEEWAIHDTEGFPRGAVDRLSIADLCTVLAIDNPCAVDLVLDGVCSADECEGWIADHYEGEASDMADFAHRTADDAGQVDELPEWVRAYVDWEAIGRDYVLSGDFFTMPGVGCVYVFRS